MEPQVLMAIQGDDPASENAWGIQSGTNKGQEEPKRETEEEDELFIFRPLLSHLQLENLPELAISLRTALFGGDTCNPLTCTVSPRPMIGTYNILYRVTFSDSTEWLFKIPFIGNLPEWIEASGRKLRSEVNTMRFIRKYTKIPVPEVYAFDCHLDNLINAPYIAMEFINGITMLTKWFAKPGGYEQLSEEQLEERRVRWLKAVAEYMFELGKFRFDQCGMLDFKDGRDWPISIDPLRVPDMLAESQAEPSPDVVAQKYRDIGPFSDTKSYLLGLLYLQASNTSAIHPHRILRQLIKWIPESIANFQLGPHGHRFVLCHPDLDLDNIMISNDGECRILSIIDWDGATTSPLCIGNERYPSWLSREWHPVVYHYDPHDPENNDLENSPEELERFRDIYSTYMQDLVGCEREALTEFSHIYEMLEIAAANVYSIKSIVHSLCRKCITASRPRDLDDDEDIYLYDVIQAFEGDFPEQMVIDRLRDGFLQLCGQEF